MAKIVINACYGGYGISEKAKAELLKRCGYIVKVEVVNKWNDEEVFILHNNTWIDIWDLIKINPDIADLFSRTSTALINLIEEWGSDKVSGAFAELEIVDVEPGKKFIIDEYDGLESIVYEDQFDWKIL